MKRHDNKKEKPRLIKGNILQVKPGSPRKHCPKEAISKPYACHNRHEKRPGLRILSNTTTSRGVQVKLITRFIVRYRMPDERRAEEPRSTRKDRGRLLSPA